MLLDVSIDHRSLTSLPGMSTCLNPVRTASGEPPGKWSDTLLALEMLIKWGDGLQDFTLLGAFQYMRRSSKILGSSHVRLGSLKTSIQFGAPQWMATPITKLGPHLLETIGNVDTSYHHSIPFIKGY